MKTARLGKECVLWCGSVQSKGYGHLIIDGTHHLAHRVAYKMANPSEDIGGLSILHRCDIRRCIEPTHLFPGTAQQNTDDMMSKNRWRQPSRGRRGPGSGRRKLTWDVVRQIRSEYRPGQYGFGCERLGAKYGVSDTAIFNIVKGKTWKQEKAKNEREGKVVGKILSHLPK